MSTPKTTNKPLVSVGHKTFRSLLVELLNSRTQAEAAEVLGVAQCRFSAYLSEKHKALPRRKLAREMARRLGVDQEWFCALTNPYNKT